MSPLLLIAIGVLALTILGAGIALIVGAGSTNVEERLDQFVGPQTFEPTFVDEEEPIYARGDDVRDRIDKAFAGRSFSERIRSRMARADIKLKVFEYVILQVVAAVVLGAILFFLFRNAILFGIIGALAGLITPRIVTNVMATRRLQSFDDKLSDTLNLLVNSLSSGYSVLQGMESVATEMPPPVNAEFERVVQEVRLGLGLDQALSNMLRRMPSEDLDLVVTAVNIQRETGGNLAEILNTISVTIRERVRIKREIRTLTAQVRASAYVVTALPFALALILYLINEPYVRQLLVQERPFILEPYLPCGWLMIGAAVLMMVFGSLVIRKIVDIEV